MLRSVLESLAVLWPAPVETDPRLRQALGFLDSDLDAGTVYRASYAASVALAIPAVVGSLVPGGWLFAVPALLVAVAVATAGPTVPRLAARARRTRALGSAPSLVTRATLAMRLSPSPERAAAFAADASEGLLAESLSGHVRRSATDPEPGFRSFAAEWESWFPELERAFSLVESAGGVPADQRPDVLDRARATVLDAARDHMSAFAASIRGPATAVYAFGVLLPLALVSLLPAIRAAGVPASLGLIVVVYDLLLPLALLGASAWLLARRPVAFPPPAIDGSHPDVPASRWRGPVAGVAAGSGAGLLATWLLPSWTTPLAALGCGAGTALVVHFRPARSVHDDVRAVEDGLSDALALLGRRVERGEAVESALPAVADAVHGRTGDVLADAARRQRRLGVGVEAAFLGPGGALAAVPSHRARGAASLLALAATEGRPAGTAVATMGDHLEELATVETEARRSVEQVTSTLSNTAAVFGPLVGGATVALAGTMGSAGPLTSGGTTAGLGLAVGSYVLVLAAILTALATGLSRGFDRTLVGYRVGGALLGATATYLAAVVGTGLVV